MKNVLVIGNGGREHAIAWKLSQSKAVKTVYLAPGNAARFEKSENVPVPATDIPALAEFAKQNDICFTVVGPEAPLAAGLVDVFQKEKLPVFGPLQAAANLEASKVFAKEIMEASGVPTARAKSFTEPDAARAYVESLGAPIVIKADGLAAGKGVVVADDIQTAHEAIRDCLEHQRFGSSGAEVLIEEFLPGREASVMAVISGESICMLPVSSDYKRVFDNQEGPNTGGMGAISPTTVFSEDRLEEAKETVFRPVVKELSKRGIPYTGFLYAGLMVHEDGSYKVLEFNCRLGDPETQPLMLRIEDDFFHLLELAVFTPEKLPSRVALSDDTAMTVVLASEGYPGEVNDGKVIHGLDSLPEGIIVFQAGTKREGDTVISSGGRILSVTASADSAEAVIKKIYDAIPSVSFEGMHYRKDIGR
jgi:phosphoribosylamine---glycine ligase